MLCSPRFIIFAEQLLEQITGFAFYTVVYADDLRMHMPVLKPTLANQNCRNNQ